MEIIIDMLIIGAETVIIANQIVETKLTCNILGSTVRWI